MSAATPRPPTEPNTKRPLRGGVFHVRAQVLSADDIRRAIDAESAGWERCARRAPSVNVPCSAMRRKWRSSSSIRLSYPICDADSHHLNNRLA